MILLDANILIYAVNADAPRHQRAKSWLASALNGDEPVAFAWNVLVAFLRITTRPGIFARPLSIDAAFATLAAWLDQPSATIINPGSRHLRIMRDLLQSLGTGGNLTSDAHLAALAIEHTAELCSTDGDFARFPGLQFRNPLTEGI